jgi:hypothetical protein
MPRIAVSVLIFLLLAGGWIWWSGKTHLSGRTESSLVKNGTEISSSATALAGHHPMAPVFPVASEMQEYRSTEEQTLRAHPELAAEYKELIDEMAGQEKDLEAAMIKADPAVAPVVAKLRALRERNTNPSSTSGK